PRSGVGLDELLGHGRDLFQGAVELLASGGDHQLQEYAALRLGREHALGQRDELSAGFKPPDADDWRSDCQPAGTEFGQGASKITRYRCSRLPAKGHGVPETRAKLTEFAGQNELRSLGGKGRECFWRGLSCCDLHPWPNA